ncbi:B3GALT1.2 family protein [Megaselia abdita]
MFSPRKCIRFTIKTTLILIVSIVVIDFFGLVKHLFELNYYTLFNYPLEGDVLKYAHQIRFNQVPEVAPINFYNYTFLKSAKEKCISDDGPIVPKITIVVKSAMKHFERRSAIRQSWGFERRFSDVKIRTVFVLGVSSDNENLQKHIDNEDDQFHDIIQGNFEDTYFNNTIKTMMGFKWAANFCSTSKFYFFADDDYYLSVKNMLRFLQNPTRYPVYLEEADETLRKLSRRLKEAKLTNQTLHNELLKEMNEALAKGVVSHQQKKHYHEIENYVIKNGVNFNSINREALGFENDPDLTKDDRLFAGYVFNSSPHRHKSSKWYVSLSEYPFHMWPTYVTAGAFFLSRDALLDMYFTSMYTKHFRFDDVYLGLVALKAKITPLHNEEFYFYKASYAGTQSYRYVIASHGYDDMREMTRIWNECRAAGHA